jgi:hypothetical protein
MCLSLEPYDVETLEQLCHFTSRSVLCNHMVYLTFPFSQALSLILRVILFLSANIFVVVHSQEVPMLHLVYRKSKEKF